MAVGKIVYSERQANVKGMLVKILSDISPDEDFLSIDDSLPIREQTGTDSMDFLDLIMELRKRASIEVPEKDYENLRTMESAVNYIETKLPKDYSF